MSHTFLRKTPCGRAKTIHSQTEKDKGDGDLLITKNEGRQEEQEKEIVLQVVR